MKKAQIIIDEWKKGRMKKKIERLQKIQEQEIKKGRIDVKAVIKDEFWERGQNKPRDKK